MSESITDLIVKRDAICYSLIEAEGLEIIRLERILEYLEQRISTLGGDCDQYTRTIQDHAANS